MLIRNYRKNIGLMAGVEFFAFLGITSFWILFLNQNGMSLWQIGLLESIFHTTSLLCEIPSGMLADRYSYKTNLYLSRIAGIVSSVLMLTGQGNFWIYALAMAVSALSYNFDSGTSAAMVYDSTVEAGLKERYLSISSFMSGVAEGTRSLGTVLAGFFVHGQLHLTYYIMIGTSIVVLFLTWMLKEPSVKAEKAERLTMKKIIWAVKEELQRNPSLFIWMILSQIIGTLMCMFYFYYQNQLPDLKDWQISVVMLIGSALNILAVYLASVIGKKYSALKLFPSVVLLTGASYLLSYFGTPLIYILIYLISNALYALFQPIFDNDLQERLPSEVRATMLSVYSMMFSLSMIVFFPLTGWLIDHLGFVVTFLYLGFFLVMISLLLTIFLGKMAKRIDDKVIP